MYSVLSTIITSLHVFVCIMLILVVLLQQGKGADMGAAFGGGSNTLFGAGGADNLLTRVTTGLAACFMLGAMYLARPGNLASGSENSVFSGVPAPKSEESKNSPISKGLDVEAVPEAQTPATPPDGSAAAKAVAPEATPAPAPTPAPAAESPGSSPAAAPVAPSDPAPSSPASQPSP